MWLKSGGYIVIDHTEALVSIDVNTGKYVGKRDFEQTVLKINLEAVSEVDAPDPPARSRRHHHHRLHRHGSRASTASRSTRPLKRALADDKARTNVLEISELGLVEMTRKRVRQDLRSLLTAACPTCQGAGVVKIDETLAAEIFRAMQAKAAAEAPAAEGREIMVRVHPDVAGYLEATVGADLERLQTGLEVKITVQAVTGQSQREEYESALAWPLMAKTPPLARQHHAASWPTCAWPRARATASALALAIDQMRTLALSPRYWERYLGLLRNPLARLVDLLSIKQGERIAHQKGWKLPRPAPASAETKARRGGKKPPARRRRADGSPTVQPSLFE